MLNYQIFDTTGVSNMTLGGGTMGTLCFRGFLELEMEWNMTNQMFGLDWNSINHQKEYTDLQLHQCYYWCSIKLNTSFIDSIKSTNPK